MGRSGKLTALIVQRTKEPGRYGDGGNLWLRVLPGGKKTWECRYTMAKRSRCMGLGALQDTTLAEARELAREARKLAKQGIDPIEARRRARADAMQGAGIQFREVANYYIAAHEAGWRNEKHRKQWRATLDAYVIPVFGDRAVTVIETGDVMRVLEPLWRGKSETANRLRGRIEAILDYATARGWRSGENPARWKGHLAKLLPERAKVRKVEHHAALPWREIGTFMSELRQQSGASARALEFTILTAARSGEVMGARWSEIDLDRGTWTIPAERMKGGREHCVPLSGPALTVLREMQQFQHEHQSYVFAGGKIGRPLNATAFLFTLRRMCRGDLTTHGFRSTFRDWCAEETDYPREVAEAALAHSLRDKVEAAYRRGDFFEKRRRLMDEWAEFCARTAPKRTAPESNGEPSRPA